jgi:hypothetical protein
VRIDRIELRLCRLPLVHFFETSFGRSYDRTFVLATVFGDGESGWGEGVAEANPYYSSETTETVWHIITEFLAPRLLGRHFEHPQEIFDALKPIRGHNMAKATVARPRRHSASHRVRSVDRHPGFARPAERKGGARACGRLPPHQDQDQARMGCRRC